MKLLPVYIIAMFTLNSNVFAQNNDEAVFLNPDTVYRYRGIIPPVEFQYDLNRFYRQPLTDQIPIDVLLNENPSTVWLKTEMLISNYSSSDENKFDAYFTSPLHKQFLEDSEFDMIRYVLAMAQLGAVAYMAYRHIKKYGFLK